jgi:transglutaminase-like putative cysteine protease
MNAPSVTPARHEWIRPLTHREKLSLAREIVATYLRVRRLLKRDDLPTVLARLRSAGADRSAFADALAEKAAAIRLGRAIGRTLSLVPGDSRCLVRSLVLTALLARRGVDARLVIGVATGPDFQAHAWVESDGVALLPPLDDVHERLVDL